jgi:hypothetical protein
MHNAEWHNARFGMPGALLLVLFRCSTEPQRVFDLEFVGVHRFVILGNVKPALGELQPDRHPEVKRALLLQPDLRGLVVYEVLEEDVTNLR